MVNWSNKSGQLRVMSVNWGVFKWQLRAMLVKGGSSNGNWGQCWSMGRLQMAIGGNVGQWGVFKWQLGQLNGHWD